MTRGSKPTPKQTKLPEVTAWSYSRYASYKTCPAQFMYKNLLRLPDTGSAAMDRGNRIHKEAEDYIKAKGDLTDDLKNVATELNFLKDNFAIAEQEWGFRRDWGWTGRPGWFGPDVWFRMKADVVLAYDDDTGLVGDWKTGKMYLDNEDQIQLFGAATLRKFPNWTEVDVRLWYTDIDADENERQFVYTRAEGDLILKDWEKKIIPMFKDRKFAPTPSQKCTWCSYSKVKGGPCKF